MWTGIARWTKGAYSAPSANGVARQGDAGDHARCARDHKGQFDARVVASLAGVADRGGTRDPSDSDEQSEREDVRESKQPRHALDEPRRDLLVPDRGSLWTAMKEGLLGETLRVSSRSESKE